jgi:small-conductance mechanosensitive channel
MIEVKVPLKKGSDVQAALSAFVAGAAGAVDKTPPPAVVVSAVMESAVILSLNAWVDAAHFRQASSELAQRAAALIDF